MGCGMIPQSVGNPNWAINLDPNPNKILIHRWYLRLFNMSLSEPLNHCTWASSVKKMYSALMHIVFLWPYARATK